MYTIFILSIYRYSILIDTIVNPCHNTAYILLVINEFISVIINPHPRALIELNFKKFIQL